MARAGSGPAGRGIDCIPFNYVGNEPEEYRYRKRCSRRDSEEYQEDENDRPKGHCLKEGKPALRIHTGSFSVPGT